MRTDRSNDFYWTIIDPFGKIYALPRHLKRVLYEHDWTKMSHTYIHKNQSEIILRNDSKVAAFRFSQEGQITLSRYYFDTTIPIDTMNISDDKIVVGYDGQIY